jgi:hypothetical protein
VAQLAEPRGSLKAETCGPNNGIRIKSCIDIKMWQWIRNQLCSDEVTPAIIGTVIIGYCQFLCHRHQWEDILICRMQQYSEAKQDENLTVSIQDLTATM